MTDAAFGILGCGTYVPRYRLPGKLVAHAHSWFQPSLKGVSKLTRSFANWDEDALTMSVEAGRRCLADTSAGVDELVLASTTLPFADRSNAGIVREALDLDETTVVSDRGGSQRAATSALSRVLAMDAEATTLLLASDCYDPKPASPDEATTGHAAAALLVGHGKPLATLKASVTLNQDFVDHYRSSESDFNYALEPRWVRDAGYRELVKRAFDTAMTQAGIDTPDQLIVAAPGGLANALAKILDMPNSGSGLTASIGYTGCAHALFLLSDALSSAARGETIALVSIGQGIDLLVFEVHDVAEVSRHASSITEDNYSRYLTQRGLLSIDEGIRAERDNRTSQSAAWRKHEAITGFKGGQCNKCGTLQFPMSRVCVSCGAEDSQTMVRIADRKGTVRSFTEDWLAFTQRPPLVFGNVGFGDGANVMMEFTDVESGQLQVGMPVELRFRIKDFDDRRGFRRYFWKPTSEGTPNG